MKRRSFDLTGLGATGMVVGRVSNTRKQNKTTQKNHMKTFKLNNAGKTEMPQVISKLRSGRRSDHD